jgi:hypothetical protein
MLQVWARNWKLETIRITRLCSGCSEIKCERDLFFYWKESKKPNFIINKLLD